MGFPCGSAGKELACNAGDPGSSPESRRSAGERKGKLKEESEKVGLKLNIQKTKIVACGPITSWEIDGETVKQWLTLFWGAPKSVQMVTTAMKLKDPWSLEGKL